MTSAVLRSMRPSFLILTPVCVFLGYAAAFKYLDATPYLNLILTLIAAILAHISVNTFNEYFDYQSGLDALTQRTPFSGGSGALIDEPEALNKVFLVAVLSLAGTIFIGIYFTVLLGATILLLGMVGVLIIVSYTHYLNKNPLLCLIAPGTAFGPLMVTGSAWVFTGEFIPLAALVSLLPFFLVNNLLLLNQLPDIEADKQVGRKHLAIVFGIGFSLHIYGLFLLAASAVIVLLVFQELLNSLSLITLLPLALGFWVYLQLLKCRQQIENILPFMAANVLVVLITPAVLALSMLWV